MNAKQTQELAIRAIIEGDVKALKGLLKEHPDLAKTKIIDEGYGTSILHYVAANGVSDKYQKTPTNAVVIAQMLCEAGADPNAVSDYYGGSNALESLVSSVHPYTAGVQEELVSVLIKNGALVDGPQADGMPLSTALAFWYPGAAARHQRSVPGVFPDSNPVGGAKPEPGRRAVAPWPAGPRRGQAKGARHARRPRFRHR